jgi:class 3 adenylate cyclase
MGADEEGTLNRLKARRRELVDPKIREHHGRIVKTTGDSMLVEVSRQRSHSIPISSGQTCSSVGR